MLYLELIAGFALLLVGAEFLVRGAVGLAERLGVSQLVIGLTVVAYCTTMPELVVSLEAALRESPGISIGNIVGSNICNILLILGASACIHPIALGPGVFRFEAMAALAATVLFSGLAWTGQLGRVDGTVLLVCLALFTWYSLRLARRDRRSKEGDGEGREGDGPPFRSSVSALAVGVVGVVVGSHFLINGAIGLARALGVAEAVIGVTVVALGTSLPELATAVVSAYRRHSEVAVGNVVGANVFNLLAIGGAVAVISPLGVEGKIIATGLPTMLAATAFLAFWLAFRAGLGRLLGVVFLTVYAAYAAYQYAPVG